MTLLADALRKVNWLPIYRMDSCEDMVELFYYIALTLLDHYLPLRQVTENANDKP